MSALGVGENFLQCSSLLVLRASQTLSSSSYQPGKGFILLCYFGEIMRGFRNKFHYPSFNFDYRVHLSLQRPCQEQWVTPSDYRSENYKVDSWIVFFFFFSFQAMCFSFAFKVFQAEHGKLSLQSWTPYQLGMQIPHSHLLSAGHGLRSSKYRDETEIWKSRISPAADFIPTPIRAICYSER